MILNIKLVGVLFAILFIAAAVCMATGSYAIGFMCIIGLGLLSSHMRKNEKYYDSELDDIFGKDDELI